MSRSSSFNTVRRADLVLFGNLSELLMSDVVMTWEGRVEGERPARDVRVSLRYRASADFWRSRRSLTPSIKA